MTAQMQKESLIYKSATWANAADIIIYSLDKKPESRLLQSIWSKAHFGRGNVIPYWLKLDLTGHSLTIRQVILPVYLY